VGWGMQLSHTKLVPGPGGQGSWWGRHLVGPKEWGSWQGMDPVVPHGAGAWQGLRGGNSGRAWSRLRCRAWCSLRGRDPIRAWIWHGAGAQHGLRGGDHSCAWIWHETGAQHGLRGREPGRVEWQLHKPIGRGTGRPAVLLLGHGMEKPSTI
jgi:hypothetical protein